MAFCRVYLVVLGLLSSRLVPREVAASVAPATALAQRRETTNESGPRGGERFATRWLSSINDSHSIAVNDSYDDDPSREQYDAIRKRRFGVQRLLAIRVSNRGTRPYESPTETLDEIEAAVFGTGPQHGIRHDNSLSAQMYAVSHGKLQYAPALVALSRKDNGSRDDRNETTTNSTLFDNDDDDDENVVLRSGVMELEIDVPTMIDTSNSYAHFDAVVRPALMSSAGRVLRQIHPKRQRQWHEVADHVLFCLPTGTLRDGASAMGDVGGMYSYYHYSSCTDLQVLMHELGHNLNFMHGDVNGKEYADYSGYMGGNQEVSSSWRDKLARGNAGDGSGNVKKAFNGFHHWQTGWFADRAIEIDPVTLHGRDSTVRGSSLAGTSSGGSGGGSSSLYRLVSFVDYGHADWELQAEQQNGLQPNFAVLLKVGSLYIQYNRAKGYNRDTPVANRVTITQAWTETLNTNRVAALAQGDSYTTSNFSLVSNVMQSSLPRSLTIKVCTLIQEPLGVMDYADISLHFEEIDGHSTSSASAHKSACPPGSGHASAGSGESVAWTTMVLGATQVADPVVTVCCILFLLSCLVGACFCLDGCCKFYVLRSPWRPTSATTCTHPRHRDVALQSPSFVTSTAADKRASRTEEAVTDDEDSEEDFA